MGVYLICLDEPLGHARHYSGYAKKPDCVDRLAKHGTKEGSRLLRVAKERGITWTVVQVWPEGDRAFERSLKKRGQAAICPRCRERFLAEKRIRTARARAKKKDAQHS